MDLPEPKQIPRRVGKKKGRRATVDNSKALHSFSVYARKTRSEGWYADRGRHFKKVAKGY